MLAELRVIHPLEVQLPYGERWIKPAGSTLYVPVYGPLRLPVLALRQMGVCYIPLYYTGVLDMITSPEQQEMRKNAGAPGAVSWSDTEPLPLTGGSDDDDLPWG